MRLALIVAGIALVVVIYFWSARRRRIDREAGSFDAFGAWTDDRMDPLADDAPAEDAAAVPDSSKRGADGARVETTPSAERNDSRREPSLGTLGQVDSSSSRAQPAPEATPSRAATARRDDGGRARPASAEPDMVLVLTVMAAQGQQFTGEQVRAALEGAGLALGQDGLYHFHEPAQPSGTAAVFSALNVVKPGTLDAETLRAAATPGVAMVLRLPGHVPPAPAFEQMHDAAAEIARALEGRLCDQSRSPLTRQALNHLRGQVAEYARKRRLGG